MMAGVEFTDDMFEPANLRRSLGAKDRSPEQAEVDRDLIAVDRHAGTLSGDAAQERLAVDLTGRGTEPKPMLRSRENYPAGPSGLSVRPNGSPNPDAPETLEGA